LSKIVAKRLSKEKNTLVAIQARNMTQSMMLFAITRTVAT